MSNHVVEIMVTHIGKESVFKGLHASKEDDFLDFKKDILKKLHYKNDPEKVHLIGMNLKFREEGVE
jgi:hypothetical protein